MLEQTEVRGPKAKRIVSAVKEALGDFEKMGISRLTLRQTYYRLVAAGVLQNKRSEYQYLSRVLVRARTRGWINPNRIVDGVRCIDGGDGVFTSAEDFYQYHMEKFMNIPEEFKNDRRWWGDQDVFILFAIEKDALAEVVAEETAKYHIGVAVNRGYGSYTFARQIAEIFLENAGKTRLILKYLGDLAPSGNDMARDIEKRIVEYSGLAHIKVDRIALDLPQVTRLKLAPNSIKMKDPRARAYLDEYGDVAVELEAVPPDILLEWVKDAIKAEIDQEKWKQMNRALVDEKGILVGVSEEVNKALEALRVPEYFRKWRKWYDTH